MFEIITYKEIKKNPLNGHMVSLSLYAKFHGKMYEFEYNVKRELITAAELNEEEYAIIRDLMRQEFEVTKDIVLEEHGKLDIPN